MRVRVLRSGRYRIENASGKERRAIWHYAVVRNINIGLSTSEVTSGEVNALAVLQMNTAIEERTARNNETVVYAFHPNCIPGVSIDMVKYAVCKAAVSYVRIVACVVINHETYLTAREVAAREEVITASIDAAIITVEYLEIGEAVIFGVACKNTGVAVFNVNLFRKHIVVCRIAGVRNIKAYAFNITNPYVTDHAEVRAGVATVPFNTMIGSDG